MKFKILILTLLLCLASCSKEAGLGGKNSVIGYVMTKEVDRNSFQVINEYPAFEDRIYIIYGDNASYANDYIINYNGYYSFEKLNKGNYTVFVYSECLVCSGGKEPIFMDFELKKQKEVFLVDTIYKVKYVN